MSNGLTLRQFITNKIILSSAIVILHSLVLITRSVSEHFCACTLKLSHIGENLYPFERRCYTHGQSLNLYISCMYESE